MYKANLTPPKGEAKLKVWHEMAAANFNPDRWPAQRILQEGRATVVYHL
jgi:hypothetical protein